MYIVYITIISIYGILSIDIIWIPSTRFIAFADISALQVKSLEMNSKRHIINIYNIYQYQHELAAAQRKKGTAQRFRQANSARIFVNFCWYYIISYYPPTAPFFTPLVIAHRKERW